MSLDFKFPDGTDTSQFTNEADYWSEETTSLVFNMWFCGVGQFTKQEDKDRFYRRYLMLSLSQGAPDAYLTKEFIDRAPIGLWTNGGTLTDAAFRKKLIDNLERWADTQISNQKKDTANRG